MKKLGFIFLLLHVFLLTHAQNLGIKPNWRINKPFEQKVFIENNEAQFDGKIDSGKVLFSANIDGLSLFFTSTGVTYRFDESPKITPEQREERERDKKEEELPKPTPHYFSAKWSGANPNTEIIAEDEVSFYYCYPQGNNHTTIAHAFKKLLYKNLYPGIDVEYKFPNDTSGIEYSIIVHPGADIFLIKLTYIGAKSINKNEDIIIQSTFGKFIDHAPKKSWYQENNENTTSSLNLNENEISFTAGNYDKTKTLVIDPWTTDPLFYPYDAAYEVRYDLQGNVYVYGGGNTTNWTGPFILAKINSSGSILWFYSTNGGFDDIAVNKKTGICYVGAGAYVLKVSPAGILLATANVQSQGPMYELWRMHYDHCSNQIIIAGGGGSGPQQAAILDSSLSTLNNFNVLGASDGNHDMALLATDDANGFCYMATMFNLWGETTFDNYLVKCSIPSLTPPVFMVQDGYNFHELYSINYVDDSYYYANGYNGMAVSPNWLYMYDGCTLKRIDKNSGAPNSSLYINSPYSGIVFAQWGGLDVDNCDNIYIGSVNKIELYNSNFTKSSSILMPSSTDTVYDVRISNNLLYACGKGFVAAFSIPNAPVSIIKKVTPACSGCTGTAYAYLSGCLGGAISYQWSNGATSQLITGLCPGVYSVTASVGCEPVYFDTVNVPSSPLPMVNIPTTSVTDVSCYNGSNGTLSATASGGTSPYSYFWFPSGQTNEEAESLTAGTYTIIVTDSYGCAGADTATIAQPSQNTISTSPNVAFKIGGSTTLTASSGGGTPPYTYTWNGIPGDTSITVSPLATITYTVISTDNHGCEAIGYITVDVICGNLFVPTAFSPNDPAHNNILYVRDDCIKTMDFLIFDRWGNKVFESQNPDKGWDGTSKGLPMNMGTYVWLLKATLYDGTNIEKKGNVTLIR